ncbi:MAG: 5-methylcytosine-specific restriction enzyme subunit McrC [Candidatus Scalindua rubra]|uniref:5-methylcytosine-specific restriction enzyme subunit McrC n=1 Tax=Candidatus Scalindua rubra TaxID=1872076 RepID=A0A1E3X8Z4_9BACT|nr:MAG: 5-methylcytosine-specific restriction enzyme subunit McrC [Candidatus Scalindua rubra]
MEVKTRKVNHQLTPINLFEYKWGDFPANFKEREKDFESFLDDIWKDRPKVENWYSDEIDEPETDKSKQRFIRFRTKEFSPRNYVGVIRYDDTEINLLPKIFYEEGKNPKDYDVENIHLHILYWLSYNKKIQFPKSLSDLDSIKIDSFFEILIWMFAKYTREALNKVLYQNYHEVNQDNNYIKGRLDINGYIKNNITTGNWQRITCDYDSFDIDNRFNRIIKYVSKMLLAHTENSTSQKLLYDIVFLLDDVEDTPMTLDDCDKVHLNPFYKELNAVLDYCKLLLSNSMVYSYKDEFEVFAFLLPMEKIFEDFVGGFLEENPCNSAELVKWNIQSQKPQYNLSKDPEAFTMKPDIYLTKTDDENSKMIIDTKYKILECDDSKMGVSQPDMYQMVSYGIRYEVKDIVLLYPSDKTYTVATSKHYKPISEFVVEDKFTICEENKDDGKKITISVHKLPIITENNKDEKRDFSYSVLRNNLDSQVSERLNKILLLEKE